MRKLLKIAVAALALTVSAPSLAAYSAPAAVSAVVSNTDGSALNAGQATGTTAGDLLIGYSGQRQTVKTASQSWGTQIGFRDTNASMGIYCRIATGSGDDFQIDWSGTNNSYAWVERYSGTVYTDCATIVVHTANGGTSGSTALAMPAVASVSTANTLVVGLGMKNKTATSNDAATISTAATSFTKSQQYVGTNTNVVAASGYWIQTTATDFDGTDWTVDGTAESGASQGIVLYLQPGATEAPAFDSGPTVTAVDNNTFRVTYDGNADSDNLYCGAWLKDATAPTTAEVVAGTGAHGTGTEAVTGSSDTLDFDVTDSPANPIYDVYCVTKGTSVVSSLGSQVDEYLTAPTGYQYVTLASIGTGSPCESFNTAVNPDLVAGDIIAPPTTVSPSGATLTVGTDCQYSYPDDPARALALNGAAYDVSAAGYHASDIDAVFNDPDVSCSAPIEQVIVVDAAMTGIDLDNSCSHPLGDTLTYTKDSGTEPTGVSRTANLIGDGDTPTVEDEAGAALVYRGTNPYGGYATQTLTLFPIVTWTLSDCTTGPLDAASCAGLIDALIRSTGAVNSTYQCSTTVDPNYVVSQSPAASAEIAPFTDVDLVVARRCGGGGRFRLNLGLRQ